MTITTRPFENLKEASECLLDIHACWEAAVAIAALLDDSESTSVAVPDVDVVSVRMQSPMEVVLATGLGAGGTASVSVVALLIIRRVVPNLKDLPRWIADLKIKHQEGRRDLNNAIDEAEASEARLEAGRRERERLAAEALEEIQKARDRSLLDAVIRVENVPIEMVMNMHRQFDQLVHRETERQVDQEVQSEQESEEETYDELVLEVERDEGYQARWG